MAALKHPYPPFPLRGNQCQCRGCGDLFKRTSTFDLHRTGRGADRRCLTSAEMEAKGFTKDSRGFWRRPGPKVPIDRSDGRICECGYGCPDFKGCRA